MGLSKSSVETFVSLRSRTHQTRSYRKRNLVKVLLEMSVHICLLEMCVNVEKDCSDNSVVAIKRRFQYCFLFV